MPSFANGRTESCNSGPQGDSRLYQDQVPVQRCSRTRMTFRCTWSVHLIVANRGRLGPYFCIAKLKADAQSPLVISLCPSPNISLMVKNNSHKVKQLVMISRLPLTLMQMNQSRHQCKKSNKETAFVWPVVRRLKRQKMWRKGGDSGWSILRPLFTLFNHSHPPFKTGTFLESGCDNAHPVLLKAVLAGNVILHAF